MENNAKNLPSLLCLTAQEYLKKANWIGMKIRQSWIIMKKLNYKLYTERSDVKDFMDIYFE
jgi:hypothetical protein